MKIKYISMAAFVLLAIASQKEAKAAEINPTVPTAVSVQSAPRHYAFDWIQDWLSGYLCIDAARITEESRLVGDLGMDSLDFLELSWSIEEEWQVSTDIIMSYAMTDETTVGCIVDIVERFGEL